MLYPALRCFVCGQWIFTGMRKEMDIPHDSNISKHNKTCRYLHETCTMGGIKYADV